MAGPFFTCSESVAKLVPVENIQAQIPTVSYGLILGVTLGLQNSQLCHARRHYIRSGCIIQIVF